MHINTYSNLYAPITYRVLSGTPYSINNPMPVKLNQRTHMEAKIANQVKPKTIPKNYHGADRSRAADINPILSATFTSFDFKNTNGENKFKESFVKKNAAPLRLISNSNKLSKFESDRRQFKIQSELPNYTLEKTIGEGAYAIVKFGIKNSTGNKVAVKIYDKIKLMDSHIKDCIDREIKILKRLNHPNIIGLYENIEMAYKLYLIMEFVEGTSLIEYIKSKPNSKLSESEGLSVFSQIAAGVSYLHSHGVVHRDIKLSNILIDKCGKIGRAHV